MAKKDSDGKSIAEFANDKMEASDLCAIHTGTRWNKPLVANTELAAKVKINSLGLFFAQKKRAQAPAQNMHQIKILAY